MLADVAHKIFEKQIKLNFLTKFNNRTQGSCRVNATIDSCTCIYMQCSSLGRDLECFKLVHQLCTSFNTQSLTSTPIYIHNLVHQA